MAFPAIYAITANSLTAETFRQAPSSLIAGTGVVGSGDLAVSALSTPNMSVDVAAGQVWIPGTLASTTGFGTNLNAQTGYGLPSAFNEQGCYQAWNNGTVNVVIAAADPTNPRIDIIVAYVQDAEYAGSSNQGVIGVVTGTAAPSPVAPAAPASAVVLAQVAVAAGVTSITSGDVTDERPFVALTAPARGNPAGFAYASSGDVISGTVTVTLTNAGFLKGGMTFESTGNTGLVVPVAGVYAVTGQVKVSNATATVLEAIIGKNGSTALRGGQVPGSSANYQGSVVAGLLSCVAGDVINLMYQASATVAYQIDTVGQDIYLGAALVSQ